jgi:imidazolonepropionase-like amidohydrolase
MKLKKIKKRYWLLTISFFIILSALMSLYDGEIGANIGKEYSTLSIRNVNIISMKDSVEQIQNNQLVYIVDGEIKKIQYDSGQAVLADLEISGKGKYLIPGLIDTHTHFFDVMDLPQTISYGVTSVRLMSGFRMHLRWREKIKEGKIVGPAMIISTPAFNYGNDLGPFHLNADGIDIISKINSYKNKGYDLVKVYSGLKENHLIEILSAASKFDMAVAGHLPDDLKALDAYMGEKLVSIEHIETISEILFDNNPDSVGIAELSKRLRKRNIAIVPTMTVIRNNVRVIQEGDNFITEHEELVNPLIKRLFVNNRVKRLKNASNGLKEAFLKEYELNKIILKGLHRNKVTIVAGTDTGPVYTVNGLSLLEELEIYVENGFSNYEALETATTNAANLLGNEKLGKVSEGYPAEIVLLNENPLENIKAIYNRNGVITRSKYYNSQNLDELLSISKDKTGYYRTTIRLLESLLFL